MLLFLAWCPFGSSERKPAYTPNIVIAQGFRGWSSPRRRCRLVLSALGGWLVVLGVAGAAGPMPRMLPAARAELLSVARLHAGAVLFRVERAPDGMYDQVYATSYCPKPGADPRRLQELRRRLDDRTEASLAVVAAAADYDASGVIDAEEAKLFRKLVIFGLSVAGLPPEERASPATAARALGRSLAEIEDLSTKYPALREHILSKAPTLERLLPTLPL